MAKKRKVLFVDKANDLQSQIAEYFLEREHGDLFESFSAAERWDIVDCDLISCMLSMGHDIRRHFSKNYEAIKDMEFDYLVVVGELPDDGLKHAPVHHKVIRMEFGGRRSFKATDDFELDGCYRQLVDDIQAWVKETFSSYASADAAAE